MSLGSGGPLKPKDGPKRLRFNPDDDLALLRQFVSENPLEDVEKWENIQKNVAEITGKTFTIRTLKDHLQLILEIWLQKDSDSQKKSGIEETFSERDQLLQEVSDLCKNAEPISSSKRKRPMSKEKQIAELGKKSRDQWALKFSGSEGNQEHIEVIVIDEPPATNSSNDLDDIVIENVAPPETTSEPKDNVEELLLEQHHQFLPTTPNISTNLRKEKGKKNVLGPVRHKNNRGSLIRKNALEYLQQKEDKENLIKKKDLELAERKLALEERRMNLEEKRFELEAAERKERLSFEQQRIRTEMSEREKMSSTIASQQQCIQSLMDKLGKYGKDAL